MAGRENSLRRRNSVLLLKWEIVRALVAVQMVAAFSAPVTSSGAEKAGRFDLQRAVALAQPGDTIMVPPGRYDGNLRIDKRLALIGVGKPVVHGSGAGSAITVVADSCVLRGFVVEHCGTMLVDEDAGILVKSDWNVIEENILRDVLFGIYFYHAEHNRVVDNDIAGGRDLPLGEKGSGIHVWNSRRNSFVGNRMTDVRDGFYIQFANHTWIERNTATNVRYGLHYMYADSNVFLGNSFCGNVAGAAIMYSSGIVMRNNVFAHNRGYSSFGVLFQDCHGLVADSNVIADNVVGMFFEASTNNTFRHTIIAQNDIALQMFQNSTGNTFTENNFIDNLAPLTIVGKRTETQWNHDGRGNYWSSYSGYDLDGDGIGDVPMKIQNVFQYLEGRNSNVRLYLYSPASQALAAAANAFPVLEINEEIDEHPLIQPVDLGGVCAAQKPPSAGVPTTHAAALWLLLPLAGLGFVYYRLLRSAS